MFEIFKKKKKNDIESTPKTITHKYLLSVQNKHLRNRTPQQIWFEYNEERDIDNVFNDFTTWYEYKLNTPTYKWVSTDFIIIFHRDDICSINISYSKIKG